jgi:hypothetical protein
MSADITITQDSATPKLEAVSRFMGQRAATRYVGRAVLAMTRAHLAGLSGNKQGWPSQGFYAGAARGTTLSVDGSDVRLLIDNADAPGAIKHQYNQGQEGTTHIFAGDKLLTIPARAEFYGHRAGEFQNLRFVKFASGAMALVVNTGGAVRIGMRNNKPTENNRGIGARTAGMVAFWLTDHVEQAAKPEILPTPMQYALVAKEAINDAYQQIVERGGAN